MTEKQYLTTADKAALAEKLKTGGSGGTSDYDALLNLPTINQTVIKGDRVLPDTALTNLEIEALLN